MDRDQRPENTQRNTRAAKDEAEREREELLERIVHWLETPMSVLAVLWVLVIVAELALPLPPQWSAWVLQLDTLIWAAFATEFLFEFVIAPDKLGYLRMHWLVALSVVLPVFRVVRIVPAIRALRGISLLGILLGLNRTTRAAADLFASSRLQYVVFIDAVATLVGAAGVFYFERDAPDANIRNFGDAFWWATALITTINVSGEPVTFEGRVIAFLLRLVALATFGYVTASIASFLISGRQSESRLEEKASGSNAEIALLRQEISAMREALEKLERRKEP